MAAFAAYQAHEGQYGNLSVVDMVTPDMLHMIDPHWYQFKPMNELWHSILGFAIFMLGFISLIGNYVVISVFTSTKSLRSPSNLLVVNLAFSDFLMMFTMSPPMIVNSYYGTWTFGPLACELYAMCGSLFGCASIWTMVLIAFDRYNGLQPSPHSRQSGDHFLQRPTQSTTQSCTESAIQSTELLCRRNTLPWPVQESPKLPQTFSQSLPLTLFQLKRPKPENRDTEYR